MRAGRVGAALLVTIALAPALLACGQSSGGRVADPSGLPLVPGARVVSQIKDCDLGSNAFCATELVVADQRYTSSDALLADEHRRLLALGWSGADADIGAEHAATSPHAKLRLTYSTPFGDLEGIDLGWIHRKWVIAVALSRAMFDQVPTMSMMLEPGPS